MGRFGRRTRKAIEKMLENPSYARQYVWTKIHIQRASIPLRTLANMREPYRSLLKQLYKEELETYTREKQRKQQLLRYLSRAQSAWSTPK